MLESYFRFLTPWQFASQNKIKKVNYLKGYGISCIKNKRVSIINYLIYHNEVDHHVWHQTNYLINIIIVLLQS